MLCEIGSLYGIIYGYHGAYNTLHPYPADDYTNYRRNNADDTDSSYPSVLLDPFR